MLRERGVGTFSHPTREAQRSFELVVSRHDAGPFVFNTKLRPQQTADHPQRERRCGQGLVRCIDDHVQRRLDKGGKQLNQTQRSGLPSA